mmetsp:Transcript_40084/g.78028  ORF Transcript_40084/g.78028 Transcript_40084/m.78028 type:complete len:827 (-) Transcript_40084:406-2886(-)
MNQDDISLTGLDRKKGGRPAATAYMRILKIIHESHNEDEGHYDLLVGPLKTIKQMCASLVGSLTTQFIEPLVNSVKPVARVLFDIVDEKRKAMVGEFLIRAVAQIALKWPEAIVVIREGGTGLEIGCIRLILHMLQGAEHAQQHIADTFFAKSNMDEDQRLAKAREVLGTFEWYYNPTRRYRELDGKRPVVNETDLNNVTNIRERYKTPFTRYVDYLTADAAQQPPNLIDGASGEKKGTSSFASSAGNTISASSDATRFYGGEKTDLLIDFLLERSRLNHVSLQVPIRAVHRFVIPKLGDLAPPLLGDTYCQSCGFEFRRASVDEHTCRMCLASFGTVLWERTLHKEIVQMFVVNPADSANPIRTVVDRLKNRAAEVNAKKLVDKKKCRGVKGGWRWRWLARSPKEYSLIPDGVLMNIRLELSMADLSLPLSRNYACLTWTPKYKEYKAGKDDKKVTNKRKLRATEKVLDFTRRECVRLWFTLSEHKQVVQGYESEGGWEMLLRALDVERQRALEAKENSTVEQLEWSRRMLRRIAHRDRKTLVRLGVDADRDAPPLDALDPPELFDKLKAIDEHSRLSNLVLCENLHIIQQVNRQLSKSIRSLESSSRNLISAFRRLSVATNAEKKGDSLRGFLVTWKGAVDHSTVRNYHHVEVTMKRGNLVRKTFRELKREGIIKELKSRMRPVIIDSWVSSCFRKVSDEAQRLQTFEEKLKFVFLTTESPRELGLRLVFEGQMLSAAELILDETASKGIRIESLDHTMGKDNHSIRYNPLGDRTPLREEISIVFDADELRQFVLGSSFYRPRHVLNARRVCEASQLAELLELV